MLWYCLTSRENTERKTSKVARTKSGRIMLLSKCKVYDSKNVKFFKEQIIKYIRNKETFSKS